jgi:hypothetical protein
MELHRPTPAELRVGLGALKTVALCDSIDLDPSERDLLSAVQRVFGTDLDLDRIEALGPAEVARRIADPAIRRQLVCALIVVSLIDGEASPEEAALVDAFAFALGVEERAVRNLRQLADDETIALRVDLARRFWAIDKLRERIDDEGLGALARFVRASAGRFEDAALARRFAALRALPDGTLGREYVRMQDEHGWRLPGEKGGPSDIIVFHDMTHVLGGYGTDPIGEVETACFSAGYRRKDPFAFVLFVLLQFHVGLRMTPVAKPERGRFDVERALCAIARGARMNVDLTAGWSWWDVADVTLADLRSRYGIA